jgi:serine-type D-Ala-D-Ala carboxypeptidase/endopeptidase (penicillin-binding protein 4)
MVISVRKGAFFLLRQFHTSTMPRLSLCLPLGLILGLLLSLPGSAAPVKAQSSAEPSVTPENTITLPRLTDLPLSASQTAGLTAILGRATGFRLGLLVTDAQGGQTLFSLQPDNLFTPASNMKLLSLGATLSALGPDYWFSTSVTRPAHEAPAHAAHLTLVGSGDPSLEQRAGVHSLAGLARQVYASGVRTVGGLRLDAHLIGGRAGRQEAGWTVPVAERPVTGLSLNDPSVGEGASLTTTPDTPAALLRLGRAFRAELQRAGVQVEGQLDVVASSAGQPPDAPEDGIATTRSAPLADLVNAALKRSDNVWTEQLYARLGVNSQTPLWRPASPAYARVRQDVLLALAGAAPTGLVRADGSGLSGQNRLTPRTLALLLREMYLHPIGTQLGAQAAFVQRKNLLIEALPRAGTGTATRAAALLGGTLATRLTGLDVRAKTGTLPGVSALSGYLKTRQGRVLIFSILMDGYAGPGQDLRRVQDAMLRVLAAD